MREDLSGFKDAAATTTQLLQLFDEKFEEKKSVTIYFFA